MPSLTFFNFCFTPRWHMCVLALISILLFTRLGFWQLHRADEKEQMLAVHRTLKQRPPTLWTSKSESPVQYQQIRVQGHFLIKTLLLDNQHHNHQFGYDVISPFILTNGQVILVDRGWLKGDVTRQTLPVTAVQTGHITIQGSAYYPSEKNWRLGPIFEKERDNAIIIELVDTKLIGQFLHKSLYPFIIRLDKHEAGGYVREWPIVAMPPQRHYAYALQWFAMALAVFIIFVALNTKKKV